MKKLSKICINLIVCCLVASITTISASAATYFVYEDFKYSISGNTAAINAYVGNNTNINIPETILGDKVVSIDASAFSGMKNITNVTLPDTLTTINEFAFYNMTSLESIVIPKNCDTLGLGAFQNCSALKSVTVNSQLPYITSQMFSGCSSLKEFTVPDSATIIASFAFADCTSLEKVVIPDSVTKIAANSFKNCKNLTIYGNNGSYAQQYASTNNIPFEVIDKKLMGDVNLDGELTISDVTLFQRYLADVIALGQEPRELLDYNADGKVNINDVTAIQVYIVSVA